MIDTHFHLVDEHYDNDREVVAGEFFDGKNIGVIIGCEQKDFVPTATIARKYDNAYYAIGIHPEYADVFDIDALEDHIKAGDSRLVALGEIGLDYYYTKENMEQQKIVFEQQIMLAYKYNLPIIVHCRDAYGDCMEILKRCSEYIVGGVLHCYSGSIEWAKQIIDMGMYISFTANITYKNAQRLRDVVESLPLDRILSETDSPYLSPQALRGQRNTPSNVRYVMQMIADIKGISYDEISNIIEQNTKRLFKIK